MMKDSWENLELCNIISRNKSNEFLINENIIDSESDLDINLCNDDELIEQKEEKNNTNVNEQYDIIENKDLNFYFVKIKNNLKKIYCENINKKYIDHLINNKKYELVFFILISSFGCTFLNLYNKYTALENKYNNLSNQFMHMQIMFFC